MKWVMENQEAIFIALFAISEVLASIPSIKANGIFQLIVGLLDKIAKRDE
jgi:hypothetical protein